MFTGIEYPGDPVCLGEESGVDDRKAETGAESIINTILDKK